MKTVLDVIHTRRMLSLLSLFALTSLLLAAAALQVHAQQPAPAAVFKVNSLAEPGDGTCDAAECTLREAINAANLAAGPDTITFAAGLKGNIQLTNKFGIFDDLTIQGPGAQAVSLTARQDIPLGIFEIDALPAITVTISGLTMQGASGGSSAVKIGGGVVTIHDSIFKDNDVNGNGGAVTVGDEGMLTLVSSTVRDSTALNSGGIYNRGVVHILDSKFINTRSTGVVGEGTALLNKGGTVSITNTQVISSMAKVAVANFDNGILHVTDSVFTDNERGALLNESGHMWVSGSSFTRNKQPASKGGAVSNGAFATVAGSAWMTITNSTFTGNRSGDGGAIANRNGSMLYLASSTLSGNNADSYGGGLTNEGGMVTIVNSTIRGNTTGGGSLNFNGRGGGIANRRDGTMDIRGSTINNNHAGQDGHCGGIFNDGLNSSTGVTLTIQNSTVSGNRADRYGGGICTTNFAQKSTLSVTSSTIVFNRAGDEDTGGGGIYNIASDVTLSGSIIASNYIGSGNSIENLHARADAPGTTSSLGYNLSDDSPVAYGSNDLKNTAPGVGPLDNNGGPTKTHSLMEGSAAIDGGNNKSCLDTDQRGETRPLDGDDDGKVVCDIGSVEIDEPLPGLSAGVYLPYIGK